MQLCLESIKMHAQSMDLMTALSLVKLHLRIFLRNRIFKSVLGVYY